MEKKEEEKGKEEKKQKVGSKEEPARLSKDKRQMAGDPNLFFSGFKGRAIPYYVQAEYSALLYCDIKQRLEKYSSADVCFVCDITGSMQKHLSAVKRALHDFIQDVTHEVSLTPRVAFLGYRDKADDVQLVRQDFTTSTQDLEAFIDKLICDGGHDDCEDLVLPLQTALQLEWRSELMYVYLLVDAPTHGTKYHDYKNGDDFPNDDEAQLLEKLCCHYRKMNINLIVLKCNNSVDQMLDIMRTYYDSELNKMVVIDLQNVQHQLAQQMDLDLRPQLTIAFRETIRKHFRKVTKAIVQEEIHSDPNVDLPIKFDGMLFSGKFSSAPLFKRQKYDYKISLQKTSTQSFTISTSTMGAGAFMDCYYMYQTDNPKDKYVAKIPRTAARRPDDLLPDIEGNIFSLHFALTANGYAGSNIIHVVPIMIVEIPDEISKQPMFHGSKYILAQKYLNGEFKKYNNNYGWVNREESQWKDVAQAFSHFTYEASMGTLLLVDIQGVANDQMLFLTDPAIHSTLYKQHFGETNCGILGILKFFATHTCNELCKILRLTPPSNYHDTKLPEIMAKHEGEAGFRHLYGHFEKWFEKWQKDLLSFNPDQPPEPYQAVPAAASEVVIGYSALAEPAPSGPAAP